MNFFEQQDKARKNTGRLVALFVIAVVLIVLSVYIVAVLAVGGFESSEHYPGDAPPAFTWWRPEILLFAGGARCWLSRSGRSARSGSCAAAA